MSTTSSFFDALFESGLAQAASTLMVHILTLENGGALNPLSPRDRSRNMAMSSIEVPRNPTR